MATEVKLSGLRKGMAIEVMFTNGARVSGRYVARDTTTITLERTHVQHRRSPETWESYFKRDMIERIYRDTAR